MKPDDTQTVVLEGLTKDDIQVPEGSSIKLEEVPVTYEPLGLKRIYFDQGVGEIKSMEVLKETKLGTIVCWDEIAELPVPMNRKHYGELFFQTEKEAIEGVINRLTKFSRECKADANIFSKMLK